MRSIEDKEITSSNAITFEFHKGNGVGARTPHHRTTLGKPAPSKWDDAQKWLVGLSRGSGEKNPSKTKPRNSNADDMRLIASVPQQETDHLGGDEEVEKAENEGHGQNDIETKKVDCEDSNWRINKPMESPGLGVRSVCLRDMGTEMTPITSQEPSRTTTPVRAMTPVARSPASSGASTPVRCQHGAQSGVEQHVESRSQGSPLGKQNGGTGLPYGDREEASGCRVEENQNSEQAKELNALESRALAWDEAERAKYMARYRQEEVKIQAWENHEKRKAEMEMKKIEVKAERLKAKAQEKCAKKLAETRRIAAERRAKAEAKLNEKAVNTSEKADYIRRTGHLPSLFSFKLPSICW